jgi:hypothetical protein
MMATASSNRRIMFHTHCRLLSTDQHTQMDTQQPDPDAPLPLKRAVEICFPYGGVSVSTLRTEARKGTLRLERIGGKDFVTLRAINEMRELCRVEAKVPASISGETSHTGTSGTEPVSSERAALREKLRALKKGSAPTSPNDKRQATGEVIPLGSR